MDATEVLQLTNICSSNNGHQSSLLPNNTTKGSFASVMQLAQLDATPVLQLTNTYSSNIVICISPHCFLL
jgi:hypothetical protein